MLVKELIAELQKLPQDLHVFCIDDAGTLTYPDACLISIDALSGGGEIDMPDELCDENITHAVILTDH